MSLPEARRCRPKSLALRAGFTDVLETGVLIRRAAAALFWMLGVTAVAIGRTPLARPAGAPVGG